MRLHFRWVDEAHPGPKWQELHHRSWAAYRSWFGKEGDDARPDLATCRRKLAYYMPELVPVWEHLIELCDGDEVAARMLSLYRPTPYLSGCSQAVWNGTEPVLVRNYDYHPGACECVFLRSRWRDTTVVASSDCLWGALDGVNEHGLAVALSFGGSRRVGDGFGIPLILRYVLETCRDVAGAASVLRRVPSFMAYNVSLLDASGAHAVAVLAPGRETQVERWPVATNHQRRIEWREYVEATKSVERERHLRLLLDDPDLDDRELCDAFLEPPLYSHEYHRGLGTLYTVCYRPASGSVEYVWPGASYSRSLESFDEQEIVVPLTESRPVPRRIR